MNYVLDLTVIAIVAVFVISGFKRGLINSVVHFVGAGVASVISTLVASFLSGNLYYSFIKSKIIEEAEKNMPQITLNTKPDDISDALMKDLPDFAKNALDMVGVDKNKLSNEIKNAAIDTPELVEGLIRPIILKLLTIILALALFTILVAVISLTTRSLTSAIDVMGLSFVNKFFGAVLGILAAAVIIMILSLVIYILIVFLPTDSSDILRESIDSTFLLKFIYNINIPEMIITGIIAPG